MSAANRWAVGISSTPAGALAGWSGCGIGREEAERAASVGEFLRALPEEAHTPIFTAASAAERLAGPRVARELLEAEALRRGWWRD